MSILDLSTFWQTNPTERSAAAAFSRGWRSCHWPCWQCAQLVAPGARNREPTNKNSDVSQKFASKWYHWFTGKMSPQKKKQPKKRNSKKLLSATRSWNKQQKLDRFLEMILVGPSHDESIHVSKPLMVWHVRRCQDTGVAFVKSSGTKYDGIWAPSRLRSKGTPKRKQVQVGSVGSHIITSTEVYYVANKYLYSVKKQD